MKDLFMLKKDKERLSAMTKVVLALRMEISALKTTTGFLVGSLQLTKARAVETERDPEKA